MAKIYEIQSQNEIDAKWQKILAKKKTKALKTTDKRNNITY
jgi:hypothetical protein